MRNIAHTLLACPQSLDIRKPSMRKTVAAFALSVLAVAASSKQACAQQKGSTLAELTVNRIDADTFHFSSRSIATPKKPSVVCRFTASILFIAPPFKAPLNIIGVLGTPQADGSMLVDRGTYLAIPAIRGTVALLSTDKAPSISLLAQALRNRIEHLDVGDSVTMRVIYAPAS